MAAEIVFEFQQQYPEIKLVLLNDREYETEDTGLGHWDTMVGRVVYDQKPTELSLLWIPRLKMVKEKADLIYRPEEERFTFTVGNIDFPVWISSHCSRIIITCKKYEMLDRLLYQAKKNGVEIVSYQED